MPESLRRAIAGVLLLCAAALAGLPAAPALARDEPVIARYVKKPYVNAWGIYPFAESLVQRYQMSRDTSLLFQGLDELAYLSRYTSEELRIPDSFTGKTGPVWLTRRYSCGHPTAFMVHNATIAAPYLRVIYHLLVSEPRRVSAQQRRQALELLALLEQNLAYFNGRLIERDGLMTAQSPTVPLVQKCGVLRAYKKYPVLPINMIAVYGEAYAVLFAIYRDAGLPGGSRKAARYRAITTKIAAYIRRAMAPGPAGSITWTYVPHGRWEDVSHAALTIRYFDYLRQVLPAAAPRPLMNGLARTFHFVYGGGPQEIRSHLANNYGSRGEARFVNNLSLWALLGRYDPSIIAKVKRIFAEAKDARGRPMKPNILVRAYIERYGRGR